MGAFVVHVPTNITHTQFNPRWRKMGKLKPKAWCVIESCRDTPIKKHLPGIMGRHTEPLGAASHLIHCQMLLFPCVRHIIIFIHNSTFHPGLRGEAKRFNQHCPHPASIKTYLTLVGAEASNLTDRSVICTACYMHFNDIKQNISKERLLYICLQLKGIDTILCALANKQANI